MLYNGDLTMLVVPADELPQLLPSSILNLKYWADESAAAIVAVGTKDELKNIWGSDNADLCHEIVETLTSNHKEKILQYMLESSSIMFEKNRNNNPDGSARRTVFRVKTWNTVIAPETCFVLSKNADWIQAAEQVGMHAPFAPDRNSLASPQGRKLEPQGFKK